MVSRAPSSGSSGASASKSASAKSIAASVSSQPVSKQTTTISASTVSSQVKMPSIPNASTSDIMSNYAFLLYASMLAITIMSSFGQFFCTFPGIIIAGLFYLAAPNDKKLLNHILLAAGLMLLHTALNFAAALSMLVYIGIILYPLEILLFLAVYGFLAYKCYVDREFVVYKIV